MIVVTSRQCSDIFKKRHKPHDVMALKMAAVWLSETNPLGIKRLILYCSFDFSCDIEKRFRKFVI